MYGKMPSTNEDDAIFAMAKGPPKSFKSAFCRNRFLKVFKVRLKKRKFELMTF